MPTIGTPFSKYEPLKVRAIVEEAQFSTMYVKPGLDTSSIPRFRATRQIAPELEQKLSYSIGIDLAGDDLHSALNANKINVAPAANAVKVQDFIKSGGEGISAIIKANMDYYDYYIVEMGFNVIISQGYAIPEMRYIVDIYGDSQMNPDTIAYDSFPDDDVKHVQLIKGKVSLGLDPLLKLIPFVGPVVSEVLKVELDPWEFDLGYDKIEIMYSGDLDYSIVWLMRHDNIYRGFNPIIILKKKKSISKVIAKVRAIYKLKAPKESWLHLRGPITVESDEKEVSII